MRHYEIMLLIHPERSDQVSSMVQRYTQQIESAQGVVHRFEDLKRRTLAYPIKKLNKAYYILLNVECDAKTQQKIQESIAFNDSILRCLSIRREKAIKEASILHPEGSGTTKSQSNSNSTSEASSTEAKKTTTLNHTKKRKQRTVVDLKDIDIDYKNVDFLAHCVTDTKKIQRCRVTGANAKQQHQLSEAIKRARLVGLLPYCDKYEQPEMT